LDAGIPDKPTSERNLTMLVLSRNTDDAILIGDDVEITVLEIKGNTVKLGISAPSDVSVHRSEVYVKLERSKYLWAVNEPETA